MVLHHLLSLKVTTDIYKENKVPSRTGIISTQQITGVAIRYAGPNFQDFELQMYFEVLDHVFLLANLEQYHHCYSLGACDDVCEY